jgi:pimeloyl-ACP methyl ester carboxylesterase
MGGALLTSLKKSTANGTRLLRLALALVLLVTSGCAWLDVKHRQLIYRPTPGVPASFAGLKSGDERFFLDVPQVVSDEPVNTPGSATDPLVTSEPARIEMWWLPNKDTLAPALLYFHGTFRTLVSNVRKIESLRDAGFSVLAVEYRGWGLSTPITPSEKTILQDADVAWTELQKREPRPGMRVIYGHSMGSGVAVDLASRQLPQSDYGGLILESAFTSFPDIALEVAQIAWLLSQASDERFASIEKIAKVQRPLLMIHGSLDTTVPMVLGEKLFAAANPPKQWITIEGGKHSDLDAVARGLYLQAVEDFRKAYLGQP